MGRINSRKKLIKYITQSTFNAKNLNAFHMIMPQWMNITIKEDWNKR